MTPKHHLVIHLLAKLERQGAPSVYATWLDEGLNRALKESCESTSQLTFEASVLSRMEDRLSSMRKGALKRKR